VPFAITIPLGDEEAARRSELARLLPWTDVMTRRADHPVAYVCRDFTCRAPATSPHDLEALLTS
jgi:uncharacterized protein YyaL (SSP411 family)